MTKTRVSVRNTIERATAEIALGVPLTPFTELLIEYASRDPRVCYVGVDTMDVEFQRHFPSRAFDVGIAEQNQLGIATGLAKAGMVPVVQAWSPFTPLRNFDQLRTSLARHHSNVKIVTTALGLVNCSHGATHHDMESLALFRTVPGLVILAPFDGTQFEQAFRVAMDYVGPVVIMGPPEIYAPGRDGLDSLPIQNHPPFEIGKAEWLRHGNDACLITFGPALRYTWLGAERLSQGGLSVAVVNMCSLKPLDCDSILKAATEIQAVLSVEEQTVIGGLGSAVAEVIAESGVAVRFKRMGIPDQFVENVGDWTETREGIGLTASQVVRAVKELLA
ncbi:MAG TPA: transketolase C-terminal domain-containing protein [Acidobacteriota bacterium]